MPMGFTAKGDAMKLKVLSRGVFLFLIMPPLAGCANMDAETALSARTSLIGMSQVDLETCLGLPDQKVTEGKTTIFTYNANSSRNVNLTVPIINAIGISFTGYCHATFRLEKGRVTRINYSGDADELGSKDATCAAIVRACVAQRPSQDLRN